MRPSVLPESTRVDSFTMFYKPNSFFISSSLLYLLAVLFSVICCLPQLISWRLKSPVMTTFCVLCVFYIVLLQIRGALQRIGDGHSGVGSRRQSKWIYFV